MSENYISKKTKFSFIKDKIIKCKKEVDLCKVNYFGFEKGLNLALARNDNERKRFEFQKMIDDSFDHVYGDRYSIYNPARFFELLNEGEEKEYDLKKGDKISLLDCLNSNTFLKLIDPNLELKTTDPKLEAFIKNALSADGENKKRIDLYRKILCGKLPSYDAAKDLTSWTRLLFSEKYLPLDQISVLNDKLNIKDYSLKEVNVLISKFEETCKLIRGEKDENKKATCLNLSNREEFFTLYSVLLALKTESEATELEAVERDSEFKRGHLSKFLSKVEKIEKSGDESFFEIPNEILNKLTQEELKECGITDKKEKLNCKDLSLGQLLSFCSHKFGRVEDIEAALECRCKKNPDGPAINSIIAAKNFMFLFEKLMIFKTILDIREQKFFQSLYKKNTYDDNDFKEIKLILGNKADDFSRVIKTKETLVNKNLDPRKKLEKLYNEYKKYFSISFVDHDRYGDLMREIKIFKDKFWGAVAKSKLKDIPDKLFCEIDLILFDFQLQDLKLDESSSSFKPTKSEFPAQKIRQKLNESYEKCPELCKTVYEISKKIKSSEGFLDEICSLFLNSVKDLKQKEKETSYLNVLFSEHDIPVDQVKENLESIKDEAVKDLLLDTEFLDKLDDKNIYAMNKWIYGEKIVMTLSDVAKIKKIALDEKLNVAEKDERLKALNIDISKALEDYAGLLEKHVKIDYYSIDKKLKQRFDDLLSRLKTSDLTPGVITTFFVVVFDILALVCTVFSICLSKRGRRLFRELKDIIKYGRKSLLIDDLKKVIQEDKNLKMIKTNQVKKDQSNQR